MDRSFTRLALAFGVLIAGQASADEARIVRSGQLPGVAAWLSVEGDHVAFGSGRRVFVARTSPDLAIESSFETPEEIVQGVLAGDRMYRFGRDGAFDVAEASGSWLAARHERLPFRPSGALLVAKMDEHLIIAEEGFGLHVLALPPPLSHARAHAGHAMAHGVTEVGALPLEETVRALCASDRRVYVATESGHLLVIDASDPADPQLRREIVLEQAVDALAANGSTLYALGPAGLTVLALAGDSADVENVDPAVGGGGIEVTGRALYVVSPEQGLIRFEDQDKTAAIHMVAVTNNAFTPQSITIAAGDTVQWNSMQAGGGLHNVESCDGVSDPPQCMGNVAADGAFTSGAAAFPPWSYNRVFTNSGLNRYFCVIHVNPFNMVGTVTVQATPPPGVPNGATGSALLVDKVLPNGSRLELNFDVTTCTGNTNHQVVYGFGAQLPGSLGGIYNLSGSQCSIGTSPFVWTGVPDPVADPDKLLWFLVLAKDAATTEGSWGKDSAAAERKGPATGGASGQCSITAKSLTNLCGQ